MMNPDIYLYRVIKSIRNTFDSFGYIEIFPGPKILSTLFMPIPYAIAAMACIPPCIFLRDCGAGLLSGSCI